MPCPPEGFTLYQQTAALNLRGIPIFPILISQPKPDPIFSRRTAMRCAANSPRLCPLHVLGAGISQRSRPNRPRG